MRTITEMSLRELTELMIKAQEDESAVAALFVNPRGYFLSNDIVIPMDAEIKIQHRDELRAQLLTPARLDKFSAAMREDEAAITIHIKKPLKLRCGRITIQCPKKNQESAVVGKLQAISDVPMEDVFALIHRLEEDSNESHVLEMKSHPTRFFLERGLMSPPDVRITVLETESLLTSLETERGINDFISLAEDEPVVKAKAHVKGGLANCTWIEYECEK